MVMVFTQYVNVDDVADFVCLGFGLALDRQYEGAR
jgi:hypothetical protein